jgi:hypothetical protein
MAVKVLRSLLLFYIAHDAPALYRPASWGTDLPQQLLLVAVAVEVFHIIFRPYETLPKGTLARFLKATLAVVIIAVVFAIGYPGAQATGWLTYARAVDQATSWVLCAAFAFIALFSTYFGIPWRHRLYGIGIGFLFYLSVHVAVTTVIAQYRVPPHSAIWLLDMLAFLFANVVWAYYFSAAEAPRSVPTLEQLNKLSLILSRFAIKVDGLSRAGGKRRLDHSEIAGGPERV